MPERVLSKTTTQSTVRDRQRGEGWEARTVVAVRGLLREDVQRERVVVVVDEVDHRLLGVDDHFLGATGSGEWSDGSGRAWRTDGQNGTEDLACEKSN